MAYYNYNGGKLVGKIYSFDGEIGTIISPQGEYQFTVRDLNNFDDSNYKKGTMVEFYPNIVSFDKKYNLARNVSLVKLDNGMKLNKERF